MCASGRLASWRACLLASTSDTSILLIVPNMKRDMSGRDSIVFRYDDTSPTLTVLEQNYLTSAAKRVSTTCIHYLLELSL
jgi:hypothetical protein